MSDLNDTLTIVLAVGTWNSEHWEHVKLLDAAAECGNYVIAGVLSDEAILKTAEWERVLIPVDKRLEIAKSHKVVSQAILIDDIDSAAYVKIKPDVLVTRYGQTVDVKRLEW